MTLAQRLRAALGRLLADVRFALGTAAGAVPVGAVFGALAPIPDRPLIPETAPWANRLLTISEAALTGWFVGLLWGAVVAFWSRRLAPALPPERRARAAGIAAVAAVAVAAPLLLVRVTPAWAAGGGIAAASGVMLAVMVLARSRG